MSLLDPTASLGHITIKLVNRGIEVDASTPLRGTVTGHYFTNAAFVSVRRHYVVWDLYSAALQAGPASPLGVGLPTTITAAYAEFPSMDAVRTAKCPVTIAR